LEEEDLGAEAPPAIFKGLGQPIHSVVLSWRLSVTACAKLPGLANCFPVIEPPFFTVLLSTSELFFEDLRNGSMEMLILNRDSLSTVHERTPESKCERFSPQQPCVFAGKY
jgi:hypothetical protein